MVALPLEKMGRSSFENETAAACRNIFIIIGWFFILLGNKIYDFRNMLKKNKS